MCITKQYNLLCLGIDTLLSLLKSKFLECLVGIYVAQCSSVVCLQDLDGNLGI